MASRLAPMPIAPVKQRRPRMVNTRHQAFIRKLPCVICGRSPVEAAHLRTGNLAYGKRSTGMGEKPSDEWLTPLCAGPGVHHAEQHRHGNEAEWWLSRGIDNPWALCMALYFAGLHEDEERAQTIVALHRGMVG